MPTGFTDCVRSGEVTDFRTYAMQCSRYFGATILLRDEPMSPDIPKFEVPTYHSDRIKELTDEREELLGMSGEELDATAEQIYREAMERDQEARQRIALERSRYEAMLEKAKRFEAPTKEHERFAEFIVEQLEQSIEWDCSTRYYDENKPRRMSAREYRDERLQAISKGLSYHKLELGKDIQRTEERNRWVDQLRSAVDAVTA